jgi:molybdenum cofactor cytidylyltransferase
MTMPAILLAAGASSRLGQPKQLVRIGGETLLGRTIRIVHESGAGPIFVVLGAGYETVAAAFDLSNARVVLNAHWAEGIATSIQAGISALRDDDPEAEAALLLVCDQPRLSVEHLRRLIDAYAAPCEPTIVASEYAGVAGIPAIFPASQFANLLALRGDAGARFLLRDPDCGLITRQFEGGEIDIDTPTDLQKISVAGQVATGIAGRDRGSACRGTRPAAGRIPSRSE